MGNCFHGGIFDAFNVRKPLFSRSGNDRLLSSPINRVLVSVVLFPAQQALLLKIVAHSIASALLLVSNQEALEKLGLLRKCFLCEGARVVYGSESREAKSMADLVVV